MADKPQDKETPPDERLTEIVSYLDGELDETRMNEIEHDLINDPEMRSHADILSRTWALLDSLEEVSASQKFTQDTLATVASDTIDDSGTDNVGRSLQRIRQGLTRYHAIPYFLIGLIGGAVGLFLSSYIWQRREASDELSTTRVVLDNFELIKNAEQYSVVPDSEQLRSLKLPVNNVKPSGDAQ